MSDYALIVENKELRAKLAQAEDRYHALAAATEGLCAALGEAEDVDWALGAKRKCEALIQHQAPPPTPAPWDGPCDFCGHQFRGAMTDASGGGSKHGAACPRCGFINAEADRAGTRERDVAGDVTPPREDVSIDGREA
jgi:hypothetical protein